MLVSIGQAAALIGVAVSTWRRWEKEQLFSPDLRTIGGHRRYKISHIESTFLGKKQTTHRKTLAYARVSSYDQKKDLERQIADLLFKICAHFQTEVIILGEEEERSFEETLAADVIEIVTVFTSKLCGNRSHTHRKKRAA